MKRSHDEMPNMPGASLGYYDQDRSFEGLADHHHDDAMEICYLAKGRQVYRVADKNHVLRGGDYFVSFPNEVHNTDGKPQEKGRLYWMILPLGKTAELVGVSSDVKRAVFEALLALPKRHFRGSSQSQALWSSLWKGLRQEVWSQRWGGWAYSHALQAVLMDVLECSHGSEAQPLNEAILKLCDAIEKDPRRDWALEEMAESLFISLAHFKTSFRKTMGVPPREFVLRAKIEAARQEVLQGAKISEVALSYGFSSSQYFSTVYRRFTLKSPREDARSALL